MADKVVTEFVARDRGMEAALRDVRRDIDRLANDSNRSLDRLNQRFTSMGRLVKGLFIGGAIGTGVSWAVKLAADMEQTEVAFTTLLGSGARAQKLLDELQDAAAKTPFQLDQYTDAAKKLAAFGAEAEEIPETLRRIGDVSAGIGQNIGEIAEIYGKARVQGRLFMEDINQLTGRGIPIIGALAKQFKVAESEVRGLVSSGRVGFRHLEQAFQDLTSEGGQFFNMMEAQSETLAGMWSTFKDNVAALGRELGTALLPPLKEILGVLTAMVGEWNRGDEKVGDLKGTIDAANDATFDLAMTFARIADIIRDVVLSLDIVAQRFQSPNLTDEQKETLAKHGITMSRGGLMRGPKAVRDARGIMGFLGFGEIVGEDEIRSILTGQLQGSMASAAAKTMVERLEEIRQQKKNKKLKEPGDAAARGSGGEAVPLPNLRERLDDLLGFGVSQGMIDPGQWQGLQLALNNLERTLERNTGGLGLTGKGLARGFGASIMGVSGIQAGLARSAGSAIGGFEFSGKMQQDFVEFMSTMFKGITQRVRGALNQLPADEATQQVHFEALTALSRRIQTAAAGKSPELIQQQKIEAAIEMVVGKLGDAINKASRGEFNKPVVDAVKGLASSIGLKFGP